MLILVTALSYAVPNQIVNWLDSFDVLNTLLDQIKARRMPLCDVNWIVNALLRPLGAFGMFDDLLR